MKPDESKPVEPVTNGHRQRLRERFLKSGIKGFLDYEIIELLLTLATPRKDCKAPAKETIERFKSLRGVLEATPEELKKITGIGPRNLLGIKLIKAVAERYFEERLLNRDPIKNPKILFEYLLHLLGGKNQEQFCVIFLNASNEVIVTETLFKGTLTSSAIYPREVVHAALNHHAAALIFAHNHPSGNPSPSKDDDAVTRQLVMACQVMQITVHEHLVIAGSQYFSYAEKGLIKKYRNNCDHFLKASGV